MTPDKTLAEILAWRMRIGEPMPVSLALAIVRQVCDSLEYAHNLQDPTGRPLGIVHRDVSPAHIIVSSTGSVMLVGSNTPHGTPAYVSPEYLGSGMHDPRGDLFGLGAIAHEMLANRPLFAGRDERDTHDRVWGLAIPPPSAANPLVSPELDGVVLMALARDPAYRWQHAAMLRDAVLGVAQRLGLALPAQNDPMWRALFAEPTQPAEPAPVPPAPVPPAAPAEAEPDVPPDDPELWADDTNLETRVQAADPRILALAASAPAPAPAPAAAPASAAALDLVEEPPPPPVRVIPVHAFDPELGPEPTQIGAMPLISFGNTPLVSLVGETAQRVSSPTLPPPVATFVEESPAVTQHKRGKLVKIAAIAALVAALVVVIVIATY